WRGTCWLLMPSMGFSHSGAPPLPEGCELERPITVRAARVERGWTLETLSVASQRCMTLLSRIERAVCPLTVETAEVLAEALGVSPAALLAGQERLRTERRAELLAGGPR